MTEQQDNNDQPEPEQQNKHVTMIFHSDGSVGFETWGMSVTDMWGAAKLLEIRATEMYATNQAMAAQARQKQQQNQPVVLSPEEARAYAEVLRGRGRN